MGWSDAGFRLLKYLKDFADSSAFWEATAYYNHPTNDEGKINLHHHSGWDFYITRRFDSDYDDLHATALDCLLKLCYSRGIGNFDRE